MIDPAVFARVFGGFADKIGRALAPETSAMYYDVLSEALDSTEFLAGARIVFRNHSYNTWPAPHQFIDAIKPKGSPALDGNDAFEALLGRQHPERVALGMGPAVMRAFRAAGGKREFTAVLEQDVKWLRQRFVDAYEHAARAEEADGQATLALAAVDPTAQAVIESLAEARDAKNAKPAKVLPADYKALAAGDGCPVPSTFGRPQTNEPRSDADDVVDLIRSRYIAERVAKGQYRRLCLDAGLTIPEDVLCLDPDAFLYRPQ